MATRPAVPFDFQPLAGLGVAPDPIAAAFRNTYDRIVIESQVLPRITIPLFGPATVPSMSGDAIAKLIRPKVTLSGPAGVIQTAPFGEPYRSVPYLVIASGIGGLIFLGFVLGRASKRR